jgi:alkylation response protein AidB-like acyl-CoA dehydrogenase
MEPGQILETARAIAAETLAPQAAAVDQAARWPENGIRRLQESGLTQLVVPRRFGGLGQGLLGLAQVCEILGAACASTSMCFGMHAVASAVLSAKATPDQAKRFLEPIVEGRHLTTLALSEPGTGAHFYVPRAELTDAGSHYLINGQKSFVTNGGHADSYVVSVASANDPGRGQFSCIAVPADADGLEWGEPWHGVGMRGNSSGTVVLRNVRVPKENLLGAEGDQTWFVFEVVAPYFLVAMAGTYLGIAARALAIAIDDVRQRRHAHNGLSLAKRDVIQHQIGTLWGQVEKARQLMYAAAAGLDDGRPDALTAVLAIKAEVADCCVAVANEAMTLTGGRAYAENSELARLLRDARAAHVMSPTTELLRLWVGRSVLGEPMLSDEL